jgi:hypothetical protein
MLERISSISLSVFLLVAMFEVIATKPALAYIDGGSASLIFQFLAAGALAGMFSVKMFWRRIIESISNLKLKITGSNKGDD